ncbi:MAG: hypothetical protein DSZ29_05160 [Aquificaceae bacterium]|nr:MAG: hypothetical protein DSZ29_05160 [Aquificaceae bacterium]
MAKQKISSEVFYWDAPRRRLHKRDLFPLQMEVGGHTYFVSQWTIKHFKLVDYTGDVNLNETMIIKLIIRFRDFNIQFDATATPLHYDAKNQELVATFKNIPEEHQELLKYFSEALSTGDMVNIDNVLRRVDMPVTPASTELIPPADKKSEKVKRTLYTGLYLALGSILLLFTVATLYNSFFRMQVKTAFISAPVTPVQSHGQGTIKEILVSQNDHVVLGQPLLTLDTSDSYRLPKQYKLDAAIQQVNLYKALIEDSKNRSDHQVRIGQTKLKTAKASLQASVISRNVKCNRLYASKTDRLNPKKRKAECQIARKKVVAALSKVRSSKESLYAAKKGYKNSLKGDKDSKKSLAILQAKLEQAQLKVAAIESSPESLSGIETIYSPISGKIIKISELKNQYVKTGQLVAVIQQDNSEQYIEAHLTYEEATKLKVGTRAVAYSPLLKRDYPVTLTKLDFTNDIIDGTNKSLFNNAIPKDKTAKVTFKFTDKSSETLTFALPVKLSIEKNTSFAKKIKEKVASFFDLFLASAHASSSIPESLINKTEKPPVCENAAYLFPEGFIKNIQNVNKIAVVDMHDKEISSIKKKI